MVSTGPPDENAHRGQLTDSEGRADDKELFQHSGEATAYQFFAAPAQVRFWHKADISRLSSNVRFWG
jgi:hypothetical protein